MKYGAMPKSIGQFEVQCPQMLFYQDMPVKLPKGVHPVYEERLKCFDKIIAAACCDFIGAFGLDRYVRSYVYVSAKHLFQPKGCTYNRPGWHSDGFMTSDINYIWSNRCPTVFNNTTFQLSMDDQVSLSEMEAQALPENDFSYPDNTLVRLNQFNIHRVSEPDVAGLRTFLKVSFSKDKYDLIGNTRNYLLDYNWEMKPRAASRNVPQTEMK